MRNLLWFCVGALIAAATVMLFWSIYAAVTLVLVSVITSFGAWARDEIAVFFFILFFGLPIFMVGAGSGFGLLGIVTALGLYGLILLAWKLIIRNSNEKNRQGALLLKAVEAGDLEGVIGQIRLGVDVNVRVDDGYAPYALHIAAETGRADIAKALLDAGGKVDCRNSAGETPLHLAARAGNVKCVELLIGAGADVNAETTDRYCNVTPLIYGAQGGSTKVLKLLLDAGARVDASDSSYHNTAMHTAVNFLKKDAVKFLLEAGADINKKNRWGRTPLGEAEYELETHSRFKPKKDIEGMKKSKEIIRILEASEG